MFRANVLLLNLVPGPGVGAERGGVRQPGRGAAATLHSPAAAAHEAGAAVRALAELPEGLVVHGSLEKKKNKTSRRFALPSFPAYMTSDGDNMTFWTNEPLYRSA